MNLRFLYRVLFFVGLLGFWQGIAAVGIWPPYLFPSPLDVGAALGAGFADGSLWLAIGSSLKRILIGYAISLVIGLPLGLLLGRVRWLQDTLGTMVLGMQTLPSIVWLPVALLWFGLSEVAILFVVVMGAVLSVAIATADGVKNTPVQYLRVSTNLGARGLFLYSRVILPAALPSIISGMKLGWSFSWRSLMAGELLYHGIGLGQMLNMGRELNDMAVVFGVMVVIVVLGLIVDKGVFKPLESRVRERFNLG